MRERYIKDPDGTEWVVGRKFLFGRPRYRGFRFGRKRRPEFENSLQVHRVVRSRPAPDHAVRREPPARYRDVGVVDDGPRATRRRPAATAGKKRKSSQRHRWLEAIDLPGDLFELAVLLAIVLVVLSVVVIVLPLLVLLLELLVVVALIGGRALTGRPWVVEARRIEEHPEVKAWAVTGWKASGEAVDQVAEALLLGEQPDPANAEQLHVDSA